MSFELHGILSGAVNLATWEKVMPAYEGEPESFLNNVVTPIYRVISEVLSDFILSVFFSFSLCNITKFCSNQRKLQKVKVELQTILHGETMMI